MRIKQQNFSAIIIIIFLGILFHYKNINEFPSHIHAWSQSDRYALALGFVNNNLNFFKPETFVLYPDSRKSPSHESITAVDFPIHDFIPAVFMKISGDNSPWIFRLYILLYSFLGLYFLFKLSHLLTGSFNKSIFITVFAATSPVFVYYQNGFLPTIPSLANTIIGIYFYTKYILNKNNNHFNICIAFITLAALSRTTFIIFLLAIYGLEIIRIIRGQTQIKQKIIPVLISLASIIVIYFYNKYLREKYGSIFLNFLLPVTSIHDAIEIIKIVKHNWLTQYFSTIHYVVLFVLVITSIIIIIAKKIKIKKEILTLLFLMFIFFCGCVCFALLMLHQFPEHDYYFLDTFYLPVILLLVIVVSIIPSINTKRSNLIFLLIILLISVPMIINAAYSQKDRRITGEWDRTMATINNFKNSKVYLDSIHIPTDSKMLVIDAYAPNIPFILMGRKGYFVLSTTKENISKALLWNYDYIVFQNEFFLSDIYSQYPEIISKIKKIDDNGKISICKSDDSSVNKTLYEFIGINDKSPVFQSTMTYDTSATDSWQNTNSTTTISFSGNKSGMLTKNEEYGITYKTKELPSITNKSRILLFSSNFFYETLNDCKIVVSISENGQNTYYKTYNLNDIIQHQKKWEKVDLLFQLPQVKSNDYEFSLFIWNTGKNDLFIDDFGFKIF